MPRREIRTEKQHKRAPGWCWYVWACFNNERTYMMGIPVANLVLTLALMGLLVVNRQIDVVDNGVTYYIDVFDPNFSSYVTYTVYGNCSVSSEAITTIYAATPAWNLKSIFYMLFLVIGMAMSLPLIWFAYSELMDHISIEHFQSGHRYMLLSYIVTYLMVYIIVLIIGAESSYPYFYGCYDTVLRAIRSSNATAGAAFAAAATPMVVIFALSWAGSILALLLVLVYLCLFGTPRPFYDPIGWDPQLELTRGG